jgi:peptide/nickel transport system ATP-binding protein
MAVLEVNDLATYYKLGKEEVKAVDGVTFSIDSKRTLGLAGESGCGKTTTAYSILRILPANGRIVRGSIKLGNQELTTLTDEEMRAVRWKKASIVFQYAMNAFNPVLRIGRQIVEVIREKDEVSEEEATMTVSTLFDEVGIKPERQRDFPHEFSGGMLQRAIIAQALACDPKLIIADEPVTALDVVVQNKILDLLRKLQDKYSLAVLFITHDLSVVAENCHDVGIMYAGNLVELGKAADVFKKSLHPYTFKLIGAFPSVVGPKKRLQFIPGNPPDFLNLPQGCRFNPRCPFAQHICRRDLPELREIEDGHFAKCHFAGELDFSEVQ